MNSRQKYLNSLRKEYMSKRKAYREEEFSRILWERKNVSVYTLFKAEFKNKQCYLSFATPGFLKTCSTEEDYLNKRYQQLVFTMKDLLIRRGISANEMQFLMQAGGVLPMLAGESAFELISLIDFGFYTDFDFFVEKEESFEASRIIYLHQGTSDLECSYGAYAGYVKYPICEKYPTVEKSVFPFFKLFTDSNKNQDWLQLSAIIVGLSVIFREAVRDSQGTIGIPSEVRVLLTEKQTYTIHVFERNATSYPELLKTFNTQIEMFKHYNCSVIYKVVESVSDKVMHRICHESATRIAHNYVNLMHCTEKELDETISRRLSEF